MRNMLPLVQQMEGLVPDAVIRPKVIAAVVATAVAYGLSIPSAKVDSPISHYVQTNFTGVMNTLSDINEKIVFDLKYAESLVRSIWHVRYNACHLPAGCFLAGKYDFFCSMIGVDNVISEADYAMLFEHKSAIAAASMTLQSLLKD